MNWDTLLLSMQELGIREEDLVEKFIIGSGRGGQNLHKTSSCVYLKHLPSGIEVKCQRTRSRETNRYVARKLLCEEIARRLFSIKTEKVQKMEKLRRQKRRRSRRAQQKVLEGKRKRAEVKTARGNPSED
jgi:protein subunit release factor B